MKIIKNQLFILFLLFAFGGTAQKNKESAVKTPKPTEEEKLQAEVNKKLYVMPKGSIYLLNYEKLLLNEISKYDFGKNSKGYAIL